MIHTIRLYSEDKDDKVVELVNLQEIILNTLGPDYSQAAAYFPDGSLKSILYKTIYYEVDKNDYIENARLQLDICPKSRTIKYLLTGQYNGDELSKLLGDGSMSLTSKGAMELIEEQYLRSDMFMSELRNTKIPYKEEIYKDHAQIMLRCIQSFDWKTYKNFKIVNSNP